MLNHYVKILVLLCAMCMGYASNATAQIVPSDRGEMRLTFAPLVKATAPSVVNIYATRIVRERTRISPFAGDPFFDQFFGRSFSGPVRERLTNALGSGVIVGEEGLVVTNAHVIKAAKEINVVLQDGREFEAKQVFFDERLDMAILKIDTKGEKLPEMKLGDNEALEVGDLVLAIGNPFGVGQTVTSGIVSALARTAVGITDYSFFIQTDAAINPGNSGGALVAMDGSLVGINTAIFSRDGGSLGIGFAIPVNLLKTVLASVRMGQDRLVKPWMGANGQGVTSDIAESLNLPNTRGALTTFVHPESPAAKAGLKVGDVVAKINGRDVQDPKALQFYLALIEVGATVNLDLITKDGAKTISFKAILPPDIPAREVTVLSGRHPFNGVTVMNINPAVQDELGFYEASKGVVVSEVRNRSRLGLAKGDVIVDINQTEVDSVKTLNKILSAQDTRVWRVTILRGGRRLSVVMTG